MRTRSFLAVPVALAMIFAPAGVLFGQKKSVDKTLSVRQKVELQVNDLIQNIKKTKELKSKLELNGKFIKSVREFRSQFPLQVPSDEIYMDTIVSGVNEIPDAKNFKLESCREYRDRMISLFDPKSEGKTTMPSLKSLLNIVDSICTK